MPRSSSRLAGLSPGVPVVPKRASPATQAGRKRGAKVPRLSQLSDEELMSGAALSLSTLVDRLGYDAVAAALRVHAPAVPGVSGVLASPDIPVAAPVDHVAEPVVPPAVAVAPALLPIAAVIPIVPVVDAPAPPNPVVPVPPTVSGVVPSAPPLPPGPSSTVAAAEALVRAVVPLLDPRHPLGNTASVQVAPPKPYGRTCLSEKRSAHLFLADIESFAHFSRVDPIKLLASFLQDNVRAYWANVMTLWTIDIAEGTRGPVTWKEVVTTFTAYVGEDVQEFRRQSLAMISGYGTVKLAQRENESVQEFTRRYQECLAYLKPGDVSETIKVHIYINNLLPRFRSSTMRFIHGRENTSLTQIIAHARSAEQAEFHSSECFSP
jgi:hypothetical protein